jgi:trimethylguanosine synthase
MGKKRRRGKNQPPSKRRRGFVPKTLWVEDCLELLPPSADGVEAGQHEAPVATTTMNAMDAQLWVKITAKVLATEDQDQETTTATTTNANTTTPTTTAAPSKTDDVQRATDDSVENHPLLGEAATHTTTTADAESDFLGPSGAWLVGRAKDQKQSQPTVRIETAETSPKRHTSVNEMQEAYSVIEHDHHERFDEVITVPVAPLVKNIFIQRLAANLPKVPSSHLKHLPKGDCGDGVQNPYPDVPNKYWAQRRRLFSKFDEGIQMVDAESWYSVTPELIARHIASRQCDRASAAPSLSSSSSSSHAAGTNNSNDDSNKGKSNKKIILDAFGGIGGNTIAFALHDHVDLVVCVDTDKAKLAAAANNCRVYGVPIQRVVFVHGDICDLLPHYKDGSLVDRSAPTDASGAVTDETHGYRLGGFDLLPSRIDSIFLSPPWGGVDYMEHGNRHFNLDCIKVSSTVSGKDLLRLSLNALRVPDIAMFLPRNLNGLMVAEDCFELGLRGTIEVERNYVLHKLKTITVYIAPLD